LLWEAAVEYFKWCDSNPILEDDVRGKDADHVLIERRRPYTLQGFALYCDASVHWIHNFKAGLKRDESDNSKDILYILTRIEEVVYDQKFTGASVGIFNHNIIARDLGLTDKKEFDARIDDRRKTLDELFPPIDEIRDAAKEADQ